VQCETEAESGAVIWAARGNWRPPETAGFQQMMCHTQQTHL